MHLFDFIRLLYRNTILLATIPFALALTIFILTRNQPKEYHSNALIYTGFGSGYNIESGSDAKIDYRSVNATYDNLMEIIKSRLTLEEVGLRLLARNIMQDSPNITLGEPGYEALAEVFPIDKRKEILVPGDEEKTFQNLKQHYENGNPLVENLIKGKSSYSTDKLESIEFRRVKSSDMIEISFTTYDPGLCKSTLDIFLMVFDERYRMIKEAETENVVAFFEKELEIAKHQLNQSEDELTAFRLKSRVINYNEETKALAIKKQNAIEDYSVQVMNMKATEAALKELEKKLEIREGILANNLQMVQYKEELSEATSELAKLKAAGIPDSLLVEKQVALETLREKLLTSMSSSISRSSSKEGISGLYLVNQWIDEIINLNREKVTVKASKQRLQDIDQQYDNFTPMGSTIDRMERQISVYEREFLEVLHGLNQAKLKQQNIRISSNLEILDKPSYPYEPEPSKRMIIVALGIVIGIFGVLSFLIAAELLDGSLRHPERARKFTGLEVAGAIPMLTPDFKNKYGNLDDQVNGILASKIKLNKYSVNKNDASVIVGISTQRDEGKVYVFEKIFEKMIQSGESVCLVTPHRGTDPTDLEEHQYSYRIDEQFVSNHELIDVYKKQYHYILLVIPEWVSGKIPVTLIEQAQLILWTVRADKVWSTAHKNMLEDLQKITSTKPQLIINGIKPYYLDQIVAEVPAKRSLVAKWVRKILKFELGQSDLDKLFKS